LPFTPLAIVALSNARNLLIRKLHLPGSGYARNLWTEWLTVRRESTFVTICCDSGNDQEDGIVGLCGLLDGGVDRNEYSGGAGRAGVDWNQVLMLDQLTMGRCRILLSLRRENSFSVVGANFLDFRLGEVLER
jgi:hypothetical protein